MELYHVIRHISELVTLHLLKTIDVLQEQNYLYSTT